MDDFTATMIAEGVEVASPQKTLEAWAHLIKTGLCWSLQGFFGRTAQTFIDNGMISSGGTIDYERVLELAPAFEFDE